MSLIELIFTADRSDLSVEEDNCVRVHSSLERRLLSTDDDVMTR